MPPILTTARLIFKDTITRQKGIAAFHKIIQHVLPHEPSVLQYICAVPVDDAQGTEIYMIEEYANQAASDAHLATQPVQDLIQLFTWGDVLAQPPDVHNSNVVTKKTSGSPVPVSANPAIVLMAIPSTSKLEAKDVGRWEELAQIVTKSVNEVTAFTVAEDREADSVRVEAVLQSWDACAEYEEFMVGGRRDGAEVVKMRVVDGFVGRESTSKL